jgi:hypothetical protein
MVNTHLKLVTPSIVNRTVTPKRLPNADLRTREHLTEAEVERLMNAARKNRWGHRDATMILVAYRHGLRPAELVDLRWDQIEFAAGALHVRRVKRGTPSTQPILGDELRALRRLRNLFVDYRLGVAVGQMAARAKELISLQPDVVFTQGALATAALQHESSAVPIVFVQVTDPIDAGFIASAAQPGGNITGLMTFEAGIAGKWLQMLKEIEPSVSRAAALECVP